MPSAFAIAAWMRSAVIRTASYEGYATPSTIDTEGDYSAKWYFTITDNEISIGDYIREIGIARNGGGSGSPLLLGYNLPTAIQNTNSNFFEVELEMTIS